ncbi:MAG: bifunctional demethylmenaquinone methyltransferase/2-methoxy-6-polyprenyl-1,4-benzoquinol methylase UbiE [Candidatus Competibacteraceae bacterium]|nr:bifunctional demethylmenaquinone methyltransferase/2-methoxy-6-polyprenyl-1,4-benzoquinol methylase UbiE [Candidatus Competibacteraceae bacterium]MCB1768748.1 bifunctional demethylmenaquinone methyltransferase/2-methoxy-6-polyprenyl-1,4-benzoquinol methylase UbiE [Candidatus Competibacteraceae bacterium]MCP5127067.1 bifunctional demethylmenaquinone methyltransferase/2-methoxy-6-polyprenyl-1,4-benzoquinol methylase UbiE [Gammaproteobacteria bacterium]HRX71442.1 bifunctional demethylmenaquinone
MENPETTHFGYQTVDARDKARKVAGVFDSVASRYDLMNDLMSLGVHRLWKRFAVDLCGIRPGNRVLDLAGGTGDLSSRLLPLVGPKGRVVLSDINASMLGEGRKRLVDEGAVGNITYVQADAEQLPFPDGTFDCVTIGFGLRNVTRKERALAAMQRVLKPGGRLVILEFSHPVAPGLKPAYDLYSFAILPVLGQLVAGDAASYRYLAESIRMHPDQNTLLRMMEEAGFERCQYFNLSGGIVAVHRGYKF